MATATIPGTPAYQTPGLPTDYLEPRWYAVYTCANHEKQVAAQLGDCGVEHFLPLYDVVHRWKDRRVHLRLPLFPGYVFVRLPLRERRRVLGVPGVVRLVGFGATVGVALPEAEIEALRTALVSGLRAKPHPFLGVGRRVRIIHGPLAGMEGILRRRKGHCRVILSVDLIRSSLALEAGTADLCLLPGSPRGLSQSA